jgi:hypothetical protein
MGWKRVRTGADAMGRGPGERERSRHRAGQRLSGPAVWSADGSAVAFSSTSNDLAPGDDVGDAATDIYVRDLETGVTTLRHPIRPPTRPASPGWTR